MDVSEQKIIENILAGDSQAYTVLVKRHMERVIRICELLLRSRAEAEDAAQATFLKAYASLGSFKGKSSFSTWIYRIAHNVCTDILRSPVRRKTDSLDSLNETQKDWVVSEKHDVRPEPDREWVTELLRDMKPEYREVLVLREIEDLSYEDVAKSLGCTVDSVKARLQRARRDLQERARHFLKRNTV